MNVYFPCSVVGPRCILSCLHRNEAIPVLPSPLHNTAMSGMYITTTGFSKLEKEKIQHLVQQMSGIFSNIYNLDVTHLVVKMVGSEKYKVWYKHWIVFMQTRIDVLDLTRIVIV